MAEPQRGRGPHEGGRTPGDDPGPDDPSERDPEGLLETSAPRPANPTFPGHEWLVADSPTEVLHRLLDGDPLHLADRCRLRLRQRAWYVNPERLHLRAVARTAFAAMTYDGRPALGKWLEQCIDRAVDDLRQEQYDEEFHALPPGQSEDGPFYEAFARQTGVELGLSRLACLALNNLTEETRLAFQAVGMEGKTVNRYVAEGNGPPERVRRLLRKAALSVLLVLENGRLDDDSSRDSDDF